MICERCKVNPATIHVTTIQNGEKINKYLCNNCAAEAENLSINNSFEDFFKGLLNMSLTGGKSVPSYTSQPQGYTNEPSCPMCNMTYSEFKKTGKFGCGVCYNTFVNQINPLVRRIHGSTEHIGKIPAKAGGKLKVKKEIEKLRMDLKKAIENEAFEQAAEIRDKIRDLETEGEK